MIVTPIKILELIESKFPPTVVEILRENGAVLAGGAIRDTVAELPVKDWDFFFPNQLSHDTAVAELGALYRTETKSKLATTFVIGGVIVQLINPRISHGTAWEIIQSFDFTMCQAAYDLAAHKLVAGNRFSIDTADRKLVFTGGTFIGNSFERAMRYAQRGWRMDKEECYKLTQAIRALSEEAYQIHRGYDALEVIHANA